MFLICQITQGVISQGVNLNLIKSKWVSPLGLLMSGATVWEWLQMKAVLGLVSYSRCKFSISVRQQQKAVWIRQLFLIWLTDHKSQRSWTQYKFLFVKSMIWKGNQTLTSLTQELSAGLFLADGIFLPWKTGGTANGLSGTIKRQLATSDNLPQAKTCHKRQLATSDNLPQATTCHKRQLATSDNFPQATTCHKRQLATSDNLTQAACCHWDQKAKTCHKSIEATGFHKEGEATTCHIN